MSLEIIQTGLLTTVQDFGRIGYRSLGIHPTGAMDLESFQLANALVGNTDGVAVLEIHFPGGQFLFNADAFFSITGADFSPLLNDEPVAVQCTQFASKGSLLRFTRPVSGARAYLAIAGGFEIEPWLGSCSTDLSASKGGWNGRALKAGDRLPFVFKANRPSAESVPANRVDVLLSSKVVHVLQGPEWNLLSKAAKESFLDQVWTVASQSNRMGIRLFGKTPVNAVESAMISVPVDYGTIQCLPSGELIALMADHPVTGGYPRIAHLPAFEWSRLAQATPGYSFQWQLIDTFQAAEQNVQRMNLLREMREAARSTAQLYIRAHVA